MINNEAFTDPCPECNETGVDHRGKICERCRILLEEEDLDEEERRNRAQEQRDEEYIERKIYGE